MGIENGPPTNLAAAPPARKALLDARGRPYEPALGPRLKVLLLTFIFPCVGLLGATGVYLVAIRFLEWRSGLTYTNPFTLWMFIAHVGVGVLLVLPFLYFGLAHLSSARHRKNRPAVRLGISLFLSSIVVGLTGLALIQLDVRFLNVKLPQLPTGTPGRTLVYALHALVPLVAVGLYVLHRRAGPDIQWKWGVGWGVAVVLFVGAMAVMHSQDPRKWYAKGSPDGDKYFLPSQAHTLDGKFISAQTLLMDAYCLKCHEDIYNDHLHSAHKFSSFNNPAYLFSVLETRRVANQRDGNPRASRWCAGCHDPVPFFSGAFDEPVFDDPNFDVSKHPTAGAGITCTVCHAIVNVNSRIGNADYTIDEPLHYPLATSDNPFLQWVNNQVVKAKPEFHKKTFLKDFHRTEAFCSTCHKVSIPMAVNHYKEFLRGQNHPDTFLLSGVSGHSARSFYYPPVAKTRCAECHMPLKPSQDFGSRDFDDSGERKVHNHLFLGANTGVHALLGYDGHGDIIKAQADFLRGTEPDGKDRKLRIDLFGLKQGGTIDGKLLAPLRPELPPLQPGATYLVEVVVRTLNIGHPFTQGTADSNEVWVDFQARSGERTIGRSGALDGPDDSGRVDEWAHFINLLMVDRNGNRIDRRNPQDIFTPVYNHQIPPGAAQVVHYKLDVPPNVKAPVNLKVRVRYRKFDYPYMRYVYPKGDVPKLPIVDLCADEVTLPVAGVAEQVPAQASPIKPGWQRWNDYGIGCYIEGGVGEKRGELLQARDAFQHLLELGDKDAQGHAYVNLARVAFDQGRLEDAVTALNKASQTDPPAPWWSVAWFTGLVNAQTLHLDDAIANFEQILDEKNQPRERKFDFTLDYVVLNKLGDTLFKRAQQAQFNKEGPEVRDAFLRRAVEQFQRTLQTDPEDLDAHYGLAQCYTLLGKAMPAVAPAALANPADREVLFGLGDALANDRQPRDTRFQAAAQLGRALVEYGRQPTAPNAPKLPVLQGLMGKCRPLYQQDAVPELRAAAAQVLGQLHRQAHAIFRPDETAQGRAVHLYREKHPAANHAAEAIVIYPTNRVGN
jgi:tetratricopeptide (TPR) repeat protein